MNWRGCDIIKVRYTHVWEFQRNKKIFFIKQSSQTMTKIE